MNTVHENTDIAVDLAVLRQRIIAVAVTRFANDHGIDSAHLLGDDDLTPVEILRARRALGAEIFAADDDTPLNDDGPTMHQVALFARTLKIDAVDLLRVLQPLVTGRGADDATRTLRRAAGVDDALRELDQ